MNGQGYRPIPSASSVGYSKAIERGFNHYFTFTGTASRSEYLFWWLFAAPVLVTALSFDRILGTFPNAGQPVGVLFSLCLLVLLSPTWAVTARRVRETGASSLVVVIATLLFSFTLLGVIVIGCVPAKPFYDNGFRERD